MVKVRFEVKVVGDNTNNGGSTNNGGEFRKIFGYYKFDNLASKKEVKIPVNTCFLEKLVAKMAKDWAWYKAQGSPVRKTLRIQLYRLLFYGCRYRCCCGYSGAVYEYVFERGFFKPCQVIVGVFEAYIKVFKRNTTKGCAGVAANFAQGVACAFYVSDADVTHKRFRWLLPFQVEILGPWRNAEDGNRSIDGNIVKTDILILLRGIRAQFEAQYGWALGGAAFDIDIAYYGSFAAAGHDTATGFKYAIADVDTLYRRAVFILHGKGPLGAFQGDIIIANGKEAIADGNILRAVNVYPVRAWGMIVWYGAMRGLETAVINRNLLVAVQVQVPEA